MLCCWKHLFTASIQGAAQIITVHIKTDVEILISIQQHAHKFRTAVKRYIAAFCFSVSCFCRLLAPCQQHPLFYRLSWSASVRVVPLSCFVACSINHTLTTDIEGLFYLEVIVLGIDRAHQRITFNFIKNKLSFITSLWSKKVSLFPFYQM